MSVARVWALPGLGGMGRLRAEFAAGTETPHPSHRKKQALPAVHPNSKPWEMTLSGLTESGLSGKVRSPNLLLSPALPDGAARPLRRAVSFLGSRLQRLSANHFAPSGIAHRGRSAVKRVGETATIRAALCR